ncbi:MAG: hypothetical protein NUV34_10975 [Sulfuricaulis sp.]|nr:hypothetical protein [Sulfuricaulis sp.]
MTDTTPEVTRLVRELCARKTGAERLQMGASMFETARAMVLASLPPGLSEWEIHHRLCQRFYGELADRVYGDQKRGSFGRIVG